MAEWSAITGVVVVTVLGIVILAMLLQVWRHPLAYLARKERRILARQGLRKLTLNGPSGKITFWEGGSGPPLIFLHGAGDQAGTWSRVLPQLGRGYRSLLIDFAGHGESEPRQGPLNLGMELASLETLIEARAPRDPVVLIGNSMGAWVAMLYAHRYSARVALVIAVNGGALSWTREDVSLMPPDREAARSLIRMSRGPASWNVPNFVLDDIVRQAKRGPIGRLSQNTDDMRCYFLDGHLGEIKVPVEIVWGEADHFLGLAYANRLVEGLPMARLTLLPECGHIPQRECPSVFADTVARILNSRLRASPASLTASTPAP